MKTFGKTLALLALLICQPLAANAQSQKPFIDPFDTTARSQHTAQGLLTNMLRLADSTHRSKDLSPERIREFLGVDIPKSEHYENTWILSEKITPDWQALLIFEKHEEEGSGWTSIDLFFLEKGSTRANLAEICQIDADTFEKSLLSMGYAVSNRDIRERISMYKRDRASVWLYQSVVNSRNCVIRVSLGGDSKTGDQK